MSASSVTAQNADGVYTGPAALFAGSVVATSATVLLVDDEPVRDLGSLELATHHLLDMLPRDSPLSLHSRLTVSHLSPPLPSP